MSKLKAWIKDYAYMLSTGGTMYFKRTPPKNYLESKAEGKAPVIIVPGLFTRWGFYKSAADYISLLGYPVYIVPKLGNNVKDIPTSAKKVREIIEENNLKNVVILAHSKGGLISKYVLLHENSDGRVKGVIAVATPFHGSSLANFIPISFIQELSTNSKLVRHLESQSSVNKKIVSIIPSYDNCLWRPKGSYLEGAMQNIKVEARGHSLVMNDKKVWKLIIEGIDKIAGL